jgi:hypothetical protein
MYWGSPKDNHLDQIENGTAKSIYQRTVEKYGKDEADRISRENGRKKLAELREAKLG